MCENKVLAVSQNEHFLSVYEFKSGLNWYIDKEIREGRASSGPQDACAASLLVDLLIYI